jgi:hypothetical protein
VRQGRRACAPPRGPIPRVTCTPCTSRAGRARRRRTASCTAVLYPSSKPSEYGTCSTPGRGGAEGDACARSRRHHAGGQAAQSPTGELSINLELEQELRSTKLIYGYYSSCSFAGRVEDHSIEYIWPLIRTAFSVNESQYNFVSRIGFGSADVMNCHNLQSALPFYRVKIYSGG